MMRVAAVFAIPALLLVVGCGSDASPEERAAEAERDMALVERANATLPPLDEVTPEPIAYDDIERHNLTATGCNFAPGTSLGTRVIATDGAAHMKLDGEMVRFAADSGSHELPPGIRSRYLGREQELQLALAEQDERAEADTAADEAAAGDDSAADHRGTVDYEGTVTLRDAFGRIVYQGSGLAQCHPAARGSAAAKAPSGAT